MSKQLGDGPIDERLRELMNSLARAIDGTLNEGEGGPKNGFVLIVFPLLGAEGRCNYISNAEPESVLALLKEQVKRLSWTHCEPVN